MWVIHSGELAKLVLVAILRSHLCENYYRHRHYEQEVQGLLEMVDNINGICSPNFVNSKLNSKLFHSVTRLSLTIKIDVVSFQIQTLSHKSQNRLLLLQACWVHKSRYIQILMKGYQILNCNYNNFGKLFLKS